MLKDAILETEQFVTRQLTSLNNFRHSILVITGREVRSDQSAGYVKPLHFYDYSDYVLRSVLVANKY